MDASLESVVLVSFPPSIEQKLALDTVARRMKKRLQDLEGVERVLLSGSFSRDVWNARNGCSDMDFILVLDKELHTRKSETPGDWLGHVRKELSRLFSCNIRLKRSSLGLVFNVPTTGGAHTQFVIDIVPVVVRSKNLSASHNLV